MDLRLVEAGPDAGPGLLNETGACGHVCFGRRVRGFPERFRRQGLQPCHWTKGHRELLARSLDLDMPVLAVGEGLFLLNEVFGGKPPEVCQTEAVHSDGFRKAGAKDDIRFAREQDGGDSGSGRLLPAWRRRGFAQAHGQPSGAAFASLRLRHRGRGGGGTGERRT